MPWSTPSLTTVRQNNRDAIEAKLSVPLIPNDVPRVLADANAGNAHLNLQYLDWQARQYLPDTAESEWLDRHGNIWLVNADGSRGRKVATFAAGTALIPALVDGAVLIHGAQLTGSSGSSRIVFEVTTTTTLGVGINSVPIRALDAGAAGNLASGTSLSLAAGVAGVNATAITADALTGGADQETDDDLRTRVLQRIQEPPMGGDADDYVGWTLAVPGVTRAWCSPLEMGMGTVTIRFMCDDLRASSDPNTNGFPLATDIAAVQDYLDTVRPVAVRDIFVEAPTPQPVNFGISQLRGDSPSLRAAIVANVEAMLLRKAKPAFADNGVRKPAQTIYAAWVSDAILSTSGVTSFDLAMNDAVMANAGRMAVIGTVA